MDLIVALPPTRDGNTAIAVFVDKLTRWYILAYYREEWRTKVGTYCRMSFNIMGCPQDSSMIETRELILNSGQKFFGICNVSQGLSYAFHPQTDGQTDVINKIYWRLFETFWGGKSRWLGPITSVFWIKFRSPKYWLFPFQIELCIWCCFTHFLQCVLSSQCRCKTKRSCYESRPTKRT